MKDIIIEIALKMDNFINLSLSCKKFNSYILENRDFWRRKIYYDFNYLSLEPNIKELKELYIFLKSVSKNPQYHFRKYIRKNNSEIVEIISKSFKVYYPYIGITKINNPDYFAVIDIVNISDKIPNDVCNLIDIDEMTLTSYCRNMGIPFVQNYIHYNIDNIRKNLENLNLIKMID